MQKNKKILSLILWFLSLVVLVFITSNIFSSIQENNDIIIQKQSKLNKITDDIKTLERSKNLIIGNSNESKKILKFSQNFSEDEIFKYINDYIEQTNKTYGDVILEFGSISFSEPKKSELGFKEVDINLILKTVKNSDSLLALLDYLTSDINKYSFFITDFSFPIEKSWPYKNISINLKMFIK